MATNFSCDFTRPRLAYQGDAHYPPDITCLRLTKTDSSGSPLPHRFGRIISSDPVQLWNHEAKADFNTTIRFTIKPGRGNLTPADGLSFFMVPAGYTFPSGTEGCNLGIYSGDRSVFAVEFDVFPNESEPDFPHVGINVESSAASQAVTQIPASFIGKEVELKISYTAATRVITATATADTTTGNGKLTVSTSHEFDLSCVLPDQVQVGLAGCTGYYAAIHDVSYWEFHSAFPEN